MKEVKDLSMCKERFLTLCKEIDREGIDDLLSWLKDTDFFEAPASTRFHGSYVGGLVKHSLNVFDELTRLRKAYPEIRVSNESAIICSLFHDVCKVNMYVPEKRNRKNRYGQWESYDTYAIDEKLNFGGHGSKSVYLVQYFMRLSPEEATAINCHMGAWDDCNIRAIGQAYERYPLAWLLHVADEAATYVIEKEVK